jgi:hypothetical protein
VKNAAHLPSPVNVSASLEPMDGHLGWHLSGQGGRLHGSTLYKNAVLNRQPLNSSPHKLKPVKELE